MTLTAPAARLADRVHPAVVAADSVVGERTARALEVPVAAAAPTIAVISPASRGGAAIPNLARSTARIVCVIAAPVPVHAHAWMVPTSVSKEPTVLQEYLLVVLAGSAAVLSALLRNRNA